MSIGMSMSKRSGRAYAADGQQGYRCILCSDDAKTADLAVKRAFSSVAKPSVLVWAAAWAAWLAL